MNREFIPYELALELKQLGFDEPCLAYFSKLQILHLCGYENMSDRGFVSAPTYQKAFRWFREKHNLYHMLNPFTRDEIIKGDLVEFICFGYAIQDEVVGRTDFKTHEEAELECLRQLIEIVKLK
jgi:hypothetical protein